MMRWVLLAVLVVVISTTVTVAVQFLPSGLSDDTIAGPAPSKGPTGLATVNEELTHDFGIMAQEAQGAHEWILTNTGEGDLNLTVGNSTCSCTIANIAQGGEKVLKPGEQTEIRLGWNTKKFSGAFQQSADILTNDPSRSTVKFAIKGEVRPAIVAMPLGGSGSEGLLFSNVANDQPHKQSLAVFSFDRPELKIESATIGSDRLTTEIVPLSEDNRKAFELGQGGYEIVVTLHPSPLLGDFQEELTIETDHPLRRVVKVPVSGRIVGPINVAPTSVRATVKSDEGGMRTVSLLVRNHPETTFEVQAPAGLKAEVVPSEQVARSSDGAVKFRTYRLNVTVPPGSASGLIEGEIVLKTDHPQARELRVPVKFTIVGAG